MFRVLQAMQAKRFFNAHKNTHVTINPMRYVQK